MIRMLMNDRLLVQLLMLTSELHFVSKTHLCRAESCRALDTTLRARPVVERSCNEDAFG